MKKLFSLFVPSILLAVLVMAGTALGQPQSVPNGPYVEKEQTISLNSLMTNQELYDKLFQLEQESKGTMEVELRGYSDAINGDLMEPLGYPIYLVKFGDADPSKTRILITTQIHGNETLGTEAAVELMQKLIAGGKEVNDILDKVSIWFMPRINPDGAMYQRDGEWYPIRQSLQVWDPLAFGLPAGTTAPWYYSSSVQGFDQNRDYNANLDLRIEDMDPAVVAALLNDPSYNNSAHGGFFVTPEARIVTGVFKEFSPDVYMDVHHRGFNTLTDEDNRSVSIQVAAVVATQSYYDPFSGQTYEVDADVLKLAKQVNAVGWMALQKGDSSFGAIQKYPEVDLPGTSLGAFALNDAAIMLIEMKGQTQNLGQKANGFLKQTTKDPINDILKGLADGTIYDVDPAIYDAIPESANSIRDPSVR